MFLILDYFQVNKSISKQVVDSVRKIPTDCSIASFCLVVIVRQK